MAKSCPSSQGDKICFNLSDPSLDSKMQLILCLNEIEQIMKIPFHQLRFTTDFTNQKRKVCILDINNASLAQFCFALHIM